MRHALILIALLPACHKTQRRKQDPQDTAPAHDTGPATDPGCDTGILDENGDCVPAACGSGTWGDLQLDESTVYVDIAAAEGGDGSEDAPFTSIQAGLDAAGDADGGMVAVAAGTYLENLELGRSHGAVQLAGRCKELVVIDASAGDEETPGIDVTVSSSEVAVSGVTVSGSQYIGVRVGSGTLTMRDSKVTDNAYLGLAAHQWGLYETSLVVESCEIVDNQVVGVLGQDAGTSVALRQTTIQGTRPSASVSYGYGIDVYGGASLETESCQVSENTTLGVLVEDSGSSAQLRDTVIQDTQPGDDGLFGYGIQVWRGATLVVEDGELRRNTGVGLRAHSEGTSVTLRETSIADTQPADDGQLGYGIEVHEAASLEAQACLISRSTSYGILATGAGTTISLRESTIEDTQPDADGAYGCGIEVRDGVSLRLEACEVARNAEFGIVAFEAGTTVDLNETTIQDTHPTAAGREGTGVSAQSGASLLAVACHVSGAASFGIDASGSDTSVVVRESTIRDTYGDAYGIFGYGLNASQAARLEAEDCDVSESAWVGVAAYDLGTTVDLRGTTIRDTRPNRDGDDGLGIAVIRSAQLAAESCTVSGNTAVGVYIDGPDARATLRDSLITSTKRGGIYTVAMGLCVQLSAVVEATDTEVSSNQGPGLLALGVDTQLTCSGCTLADNQFAGAVVVEDASLELTDSTIGGTTVQENIGGGVGIFAEPWLEGPPTLAVSGSTMQDNAIAGVWLSGEGSYRLSDNHIHGGAGWTRESLTKCGDAVYAGAGVTAWDGSSGLLLEDNALQDGQGAGLFLDAASAYLSGNSYAANAVDLVSQGADCGAEPEGFEGESLSSVELCPTYDYATCGDKFALVLTLADPDSGKAIMRPGRPGPGVAQLPERLPTRPRALRRAPILPPTPSAERPGARQGTAQREETAPLSPVAPGTP